jgi:hypothetical protein
MFFSHCANHSTSTQKTYPLASCHHHCRSVLMAVRRKLGLCGEPTRFQSGL